MRTTKLAALALAALVLLGCDMLGLAPPIPGAIRVHGVPGQGELVLDGTPRGPIAAQQEFGGLAAGAHLLELRRGNDVVVSMTVEVRPALILDVRVEVPPRVRQPATVASPPAGPARYRIASTPLGAAVFVDGVLIGQAPLELELTPGAHRLELRADGYAPVTQTVDASDGLGGALSITLPAVGARPAVDAEPRIRTGAGDVRGSLSREVIRAVIRRHLNEVRFCYEQELANDPALEGRVTVSFVISATGAVSSATISSTTMNRPRVEGCVAQAVRRWTFPAPDGGGVVGVNYPFVFDTDG